MECTFLLHTTKHQIKNILNCDMGKYSYGAWWLFCCYLCHNILQLFTVTSTTQHFVPVQGALYYAVNLQVFTFTSITWLLCSC